MGRSEEESALKRNDAAILDLLKDVAIQFNCIAVQLENLARSNERIIVTLLDRVQQPLEAEIRNVIDRIREDLDRSQNTLQLWYKELTTNVSKNGAAKLDVLHQQCNGLSSSINSILSKLNEQEKNAIKSKTRYLLIIGAITAIASLITAIIKLPGCQQVFGGR